MITKDSPPRYMCFKGEGEYDYAHFYIQPFKKDKVTVTVNSVNLYLYGYLNVAEAVRIMTILIRNYNFFLTNSEEAIQELSVRALKTIIKRKLEEDQNDE